MRYPRKARLAAVATAAVLLSSGCGFGLETLPSTGGVSGATYRVTAQFSDVVDLTVGAKVKLQGVVIGEVEAITTHDFQAQVAIDISRKFPLPAAATFQIRFTTPLGEDFISVTAPSDPTGPVLTDGAHVSAAHTEEAPTIEDTFAALSLLLNGGGLDKLQTIVRELSTALHGHSGQARDTITQLHKLVADLDSHKTDIDHLLDGLKTLSTKLDARSGLITDALQQFPATIDLLADDTRRISSLVTAVGRLGDTVRGLLGRGQKALLTDLDSLRPTLDALAASRSSLVPTFDALVRFGNLFDRATPGDYLNLAVTVQVLFDEPAQHPKQPGSSGTVPAAHDPSDAITSLLTGGITAGGHS